MSSYLQAAEVRGTEALRALDVSCMYTPCANI
jgi:hypothetical protein